MRFTRLRLNGFKSFVDPTDLVIREGLTGVVGPNGCGKSNLLEALRWVMGENRPTAMRGSGMEDVIFAGTSGRPARNFAEVVLQVDNSERRAPAGFNDSDVIEVTRRITRDAGSAYRVGGKEVRARDVSMLFADASTGSHSPALVRQGQISELINAKPKARRRILEEAAGISGLYQRRHEAELKLKQAEANLARVDDVIDQLASQLAQLARQAKQAARYRDISEQLRSAEATLLLSRWHEADVARVAAEEALTDAVKSVAAAEKAARETVHLREEAEGGLPALREEEAVAAAILQRLVVEKEGLDAAQQEAQQRISGLTRQLEQLAGDMERETHLSRDAEEAIATLSAEGLELDEAGKGHGEALEAALFQAQEAEEVLSARERDLAAATEESARLSAQHQAAEQAVSRLRRDLAKAESRDSEARTAHEAAVAVLAKGTEEQEAARVGCAQAREISEGAEQALATLETTRHEAQTLEQEARKLRTQKETEVQALASELDALEKLIVRDSAGHVQILDLVAVAPGFEKALGAALADDLKAPIIEPGVSSGWYDLPAYETTTPLPEGVEPLAQHVDLPSVLTRRMSQVGLVEDADGARLQALLHPGQRLVSRSGSLWRWDGFCQAAEDLPSEAALRLEQRNRVEALSADLSEARRVCETATAAHKAAAAALVEHDAQDKAARAARNEANLGLTTAERRMSRAEADVEMAGARAENALQRMRSAAEELEQVGRGFKEADAKLSALGELGDVKARLEDLRLTVEAARMTMLARRSAHDELDRDGKARARRVEQILNETENWSRRRAGTGARIDELIARQSASEADLKEAKAVPAHLEQRRSELAGGVAQAEQRLNAARENLLAAEQTLRAASSSERDAERLASEARETRASADARCNTARAALEASAERIVETLEQTPLELLSELDISLSDMKPQDRLEADCHKLRRQRDTLGAVNLRAEEDAAVVETEHLGLCAEKQDLERAIGKLRAGINSLNREGRERLLTAFEQVNLQFETLFNHLFGGGEARLVLVESDDPLEAGLEIMCQPPGKKLSVLSLLSGGEQTLTALALIFAVFLANPAPICVLDEVDAPLDDANVGRFCDMLAEMTRRTDTRFLVITHHAVTMGRMDRLFGVTMGEKGVSQLVSVDLAQAASLVA